MEIGYSRYPHFLVISADFALKYCTVREENKALTTGRSACSHQGEFPLFPNLTTTLMFVRTWRERVMIIIRNVHKEGRAMMTLPSSFEKEIYENISTHLWIFNGR